MVFGLGLVLRFMIEAGSPSADMYISAEATIGDRQHKVMSISMYCRWVLAACVWMKPDAIVALQLEMESICVGYNDNLK